MAAGVDHHVGRLDVAVDDPRLVREIERIEQLDHEAEHLLQVEALLGFEVVLQFLALDVLHDDVREIALGAEVVHLDDVAVVEPRHARTSRSKRTEIMRAASAIELAGEDGLDRHPAVQVGVEAVVHQAHRPLAEDALDLVAA